MAREIHKPRKAVFRMFFFIIPSPPIYAMASASPSASPILYCVTWRSHLCQTRFSQLQNEDTAPHPTIEWLLGGPKGTTGVLYTNGVCAGVESSSTDLAPVCCFLGMTWMFRNCLQFLAFQQRPRGEAVLTQRNPFLIVDL